MGKVRRDCDGEGEELPPPHQMAPGEERFLREIRLFFSLKTQVFASLSWSCLLGQGLWCWDRVRGAAPLWECPNCFWGCTHITELLFTPLMYIYLDRSTAI